MFRLVEYIILKPHAFSFLFIYLFLSTDIIVNTSSPSFTMSKVQNQAAEYSGHSSSMWYVLRVITRYLTLLFIIINNNNIINAIKTAGHLDLKISSLQRLDRSREGRAHYLAAREETEKELKCQLLQLHGILMEQLRKWLL